MLTRRFLYTLTILFLSLSTPTAAESSSQQSQYATRLAVDPSNYVTTLASRLSKLDLKLGNEVEVKSEEVAKIPRRCSYTPETIKAVAEDLLIQLSRLAASQNNYKETADKLLRNIDASVQQCKCYTGFVRAIGQNWGAFVNDLAAQSGEKRPQSTWTCDIRDNAAYKDRPSLWRM